MNKLCKKVANRKGFTLVELIVVIAILGILAGVAIPVYSGYISKANEAADLQALDAIKTAVVFKVTDQSKDHAGTVATMTVTSGSNTVAVTGDKLLNADGTAFTEVDVTGYTTVPTFKATGKESGSYTWNGSSWS